MKHIFLILTIFFSTYLAAQTTKKMTINVHDGWTNALIKNNRIQIKSVDGQVLVDTLCQNAFTYPFKNKKYRISVSTEDFFYNDSIEIEPYTLKDTKIDISLVPNEYYFAELMKKDDEKFGKVTDIIDHSQNLTYKKPKFPGDDTDLFLFVANNMKYPQKSAEKKEEGLIYVFFVVEPTGEISHIFVEKGFSIYLDLEARRIVSIMPKFSPSTINGEAVRAIVRLPINFSLSKK